MTMDNGVSGESIISLYENKSAKPEDEVDGLAPAGIFICMKICKVRIILTTMIHH